ncbi:MAG: GntR family transcriptional regulator, partial [Corynebacterium sp.]|nr:GntR family transcriptional regulator [Corynebacterium sp.]
MDETTVPLFRQIALLLEDSIVDGSLKVGER